MNLPNKITVSRIVLALVIIFVLLFPFYAVGINFPKVLLGGVPMDTKYLLAGVLFIIASLTDFLDGYLARKNKQITDTGKMLDAIADKILVNSVLIIFASVGFIPTIIPVILVVRDIVTDIIKMSVAAKGKVVMAISSGKIKTAALMVGISLMFFYNMPFEIWNLRVDLFLLYFATIMSLVSLVEYYYANKKLLFADMETEKAE